MTAAQLAKVIGTTGLLRSQEGLQVAVTVTDARESFGRLDYLVAPVAGSGTVWVSSERVSIEGESK